MTDRPLQLQILKNWRAEIRFLIFRCNADIRFTHSNQLRVLEHQYFWDATRENLSITYVTFPDIKTKLSKECTIN